MEYQQKILSVLESKIESGANLKKILFTYHLLSENISL